ncbi:hypothetical protein AB0F72_18185 [Actinoplanes sp. NPDC023936]|uniref:hypothetical protein n=1 Tax=Actinoplanes sp. NPDC023936 TaxID=3154910 RepID=UPI0033E82C2B
MARGPSTLFGAIVAVGVGPALWLGAQLGTADVAPNERPSAVVGEQYSESDMDFGGVGAGETPDRADWIRVYPDRDDSETTSSPAPKRTSMSPAAVVVTPGSPSPSPSSPAVPSSPPPPSDPAVSPSPSLEEEPPPSPSAEPSEEVSEDPEPSASTPPEDDTPEPRYSAHQHE